MKHLTQLVLILTISFCIYSCSSSAEADTILPTSFDIFTVQSNGTTVIMNGEIKSRTLQDFNTMLEIYPNINLIQIAESMGSNDDDINFETGLLLRQHGINTHLMDNADIASGGVDFFLAGVKRTRGVNTGVGVHSWSDDQGNEATDYPEDSEEHLPNIEYYEDLGYTAQWAHDFYFFTINAAPAADVHWMTEQELTQFGIFN